MEKAKILAYENVQFQFYLTFWLLECLFAVESLKSHKGTFALPERMLLWYQVDRTLWHCLAVSVMGVAVRKLAYDTKNSLLWRLLSFICVIAIDFLHCCMSLLVGCDVAHMVLVCSCEYIMTTVKTGIQAPFFFFSFLIAPSFSYSSYGTISIITVEQEKTNMRKHCCERTNFANSMQPYFTILSCKISISLLEFSAALKSLQKARKRMGQPGGIAQLQGSQRQIVKQCNCQHSLKTSFCSLYTCPY